MVSEDTRAPDHDRFRIDRVQKTGQHYAEIVSLSPKYVDRNLAAADGLTRPASLDLQLSRGAE